jgi:hypothetical protein
MGPCGVLADAGRFAAVGYPSRRAVTDVREEERLQRIQARMSAETTSTVAAVRHRPKSFTVFAAAFIAGAAAAVGVNRVLDVQLAQRRPQVECEPIFVALRPLAQGAPVTVWDVALKDWPKAMLPSSALRAGDTFEGYVLRHPVREGQPLLTVQLVKSGVATASTVATETFTPAVPAMPAASAAPTAPPSTSTQADPWMPSGLIGELTPAPGTPVAQVAPVETVPQDDDREPEVAQETAIVTKPDEPPQPTATDVVTTSPPAPDTEQPVVAPVATDPTPVEPQLAPTIASAARPMPPSPTDIDPPTRPQPTVGVENDLDEMSEAVATDVQSMPSVMKASGQPIAQSTRPAGGDAGRYLVVPERIALQADTSFTTPRPEPPGPPATATAKPAVAPRSAPSTPQSSARRGTQPRPQAAGSQQSQQQKAQSQSAARDQKQAAAPQKSWSGMFPNVAAGIEAMSGSWQRQRPTAEQATPTTQPKRR